MWEGERIEVHRAGQARGAHRRDQVVHEAEVGEALLKRRDSLPHQAPGRPNLPRHPQRVRSLGGYPPQGWRVAVEVYPWVSHQGRHRRNEANVGHCRGRKRQGHQQEPCCTPRGPLFYHPPHPPFLHFLPFFPPETTHHLLAAGQKRF